MKLGKNITLSFGFWLIICSSAGIVRTAIAQDANTSVPVVDFQGRKLAVTSKLEVDFDNYLKEAFESGLEIRFLFTVELHRIRSWWWDENIVSIPVVHSVKYDNLKKEYQVNIEGGEGNRRIVRDYQEMKKTMTLLNAVPVDLPEDSEILPEEKYYVRIMSEMPSLDPVFWFFSSTEFSTSWVESKEFSFPYASPSSSETSSTGEDKKEGTVP